MADFSHARYVPPIKSNPASSFNAKGTGPVDFSYARWVPPVTRNEDSQEDQHDQHSDKMKRKRETVDMEIEDSARQKSKKPRKVSGQELESRLNETKNAEDEVAVAAEGGPKKEKRRNKEKKDRAEKTKNKEKKAKTDKTKRKDHGEVDEPSVEELRKTRHLPEAKAAEDGAQGAGIQETVYDSKLASEEPELSTNKKKKHKKRNEREVKQETDNVRSEAVRSEANGTGAKSETSKKDTKKKKDASKKPHDQDAENDDSRHSGILAKMGKSLHHSHQWSETTAEPAKSSTDDKTGEEQLENVHGLEPLPQPEFKNLDDLGEPIFETLPPWLANPTRVQADTKAPFSNVGIDAEACKNLGAKGYREAFAVQVAALRLLLYKTKGRPGDLLVSAPTGSGKTLAYALPIVQDISQGVVTQIRALVVLPTRELVKQAQEVFELCASAYAGLDRKRVRIGVAVGSQRLKEEQGKLLEREDRYDERAYQAAKAEKERHRENDTLDQWEQDPHITKPGRWTDCIEVYNPQADVLICTPGRLVDHMKNTPGFNLNYVRWLVVDEADKLLSSSYQGWVEALAPKLEGQCMGRRTHSGFFFRGVRKIVLGATLTRDVSLLSRLHLSWPQMIVLEGGGGGTADPGMKSADFTLPDMLTELVVRVRDLNLKPIYLVELLNSYLFPLEDLTASGTNSPQKEVSHIPPSPSPEPRSLIPKADSDTSSSGTDSDSETSTSSSGTDSDSESTPATKTDNANPATSQSQANTIFPTTVLIFTKSTESVSRLARLLWHLCPSLAAQIGTLTATSQSTRSKRKTLAAFSSRRLRILVTSDLASRGLNFPGLDHVVNYDVPPSLAMYVHRVGRTARAGRGGKAWTLLPDGESGWFWGKIGKGREVVRLRPVQRVIVGDRDGEPFAKERVAEYEAALEKLGDEVGEERRRTRR
jgi:ATP-dependent RNA helicase DDX51/DBP6